MNSSLQDNLYRKIRILGVAPYEGMKTILLREAEQHPEIDIDVFVGDMQSGVEIVQKHSDKNYDVIISRGGTAELIKRSTKTPVVEVTISVYDILRAIKMAENYSEKYAIVAFPSIAGSAHILCDLLQYQVDIFTVHNVVEVRETMGWLKKTGYRMVLCDMIGNTIAKEVELNTILITSGSERIRETLEEAIRQASNLVRLSDENRFLRSILSHETVSTIVLSESGEIYYSSVGSDVLGLLKDTLDKAMPNVLADNLYKFFKNYEGTMYSFVCHRIDYAGAAYAMFSFTTSQVPYSSGKFGIQYTNLQETGDQFFNSFYSVMSSTGNFQENIENLSKSSSPIMLSGESGSGKERVARAIYSRSELRNNPFIIINCALLNEKSWNFLTNHYNSPFNDNRNTIYFEDITSLSESRMQQLQALIIDTNLGKRNRLMFSCICATGMSMPESAIRFVNLLSCVLIHIEPLRNRVDKIPSLASLYLNMLNTTTVNQVIGFEPDAVQLLKEFNWPYNYTQFKRILTELTMMTSSPYIKAQDVAVLLDKESSLLAEGNGREGRSSTFSPSQVLSDHSHSKLINLDESLEDITRSVVKSVLADCKDNQSLAAKKLGISRTTMWRYLKE